MGTLPHTLVTLGLLLIKKVTFELVRQMVHGQDLNHTATMVKRTAYTYIRTHSKCYFSAVGDPPMNTGAIVGGVMAVIATMTIAAISIVAVIVLKGKQNFKEILQE